MVVNVRKFRVTTELSFLISYDNGVSDMLLNCYVIEICFKASFSFTIYFRFRVMRNFGNGNTAEFQNQIIRMKVLIYERKRIMNRTKLMWGSKLKSSKRWFRRTTPVKIAFLSDLSGQILTLKICQCFFKENIKKKIQETTKKNICPS